MEIHSGDFTIPLTDHSTIILNFDIIKGLESLSKNHVNFKLFLVIFISATDFEWFFCLLIFPGETKELVTQFTSGQLYTKLSYIVYAVL